MQAKLKICSSQEMRELDQQKGYTAIANDVAFDVILHPKIGIASRLWMYFRFLQSGFDNREYIQLPYSELAEKFQVSKSTIKNWVRLLKENGYLEVIEIKETRNNNLPNKFRVCLPKYKITQIKEGAKNRKNQGINNKIKNNGILQSYHKSSEETKEKFIRKLVKTDDVKETPKGKKYNQKDSPALFTRLMELFHTQNGSNFVVQYIPGLTLERLGETLFVNNCSNHIQLVLKTKEKEILSIYEECTSKRCVKISFNRDETFTVISPEKRRIKHKPIKICSEGKGIGNTLMACNKPEQSHSVCRIVNAHTMERIYLRVSTISFSGKKLSASQIETLTDQIRYAIEQGSLTKYTVTHSINIAIKLIRDNRWRTPSGYPQRGAKHTGEGGSEPDSNNK